MKSISKRLSEAESILKRNKPEKLFVRLLDGTVEITDAAGVWAYFTEHKQVDAIWTETPGYEELCGTVENLCKS